MTSDHTIATAIRAARKMDKVGLREIARRASISPGYLSRLETGDAPSASEDALFAIAGALNRPPAPLMVLASSDYGQLPLEEVMPHLVIPDWTLADSERVAVGKPDIGLCRRLAHGLFVYSRLADILEAFGFQDDLASLREALSKAGPERTGTVLAFAEEQGVLGQLDRKNANTAKRRLIGHFYDPEVQKTMDRILTRVNPVIEP